MDSLCEQVGELLTIGFDGQEVDRKIEGLLRRVRPGGIIFFQRNISSAGQFYALVSALREISSAGPLFLAVDLEGGAVDRFRELIAPLPPASHAARTGSGRKLGQLAGRALATFSLNVDFAPVLDLDSSLSQPILQDRCPGRMPAEVIQFAREFLSGLEESSVLGCGKHFPGLGSGVMDSHLTTPVIGKQADDLLSEDVEPYRVLAPRLPMVMVAHAVYPTLENALTVGGKLSGIHVPASLSPRIVRGLLRERLGFSGLIVCDDLEMGGALKGRNIADAAVAALEAGCDMLLVCRHREYVEFVFDTICNVAASDPDFRALVGSAAERIRAVKQRLPWKRVIPILDTGNIQALREQIDEFGEKVHQGIVRLENTNR
jgi:beta-N-acetylhexosaminidase